MELQTKWAYSKRLVFILNRISDEKFHSTCFFRLRLTCICQHNFSFFGWCHTNRVSMAVIFFFFHFHSVFFSQFVSLLWTGAAGIRVECAIYYINGGGLVLFCTRMKMVHQMLRIKCDSMKIHKKNTRFACCKAKKNNQHNNNISRVFFLN